MYSDGTFNIAQSSPASDEIPTIEVPRDWRKDLLADGRIGELRRWFIKGFQPERGWWRHNLEVCEAHQPESFQPEDYDISPFRKYCPPGCSAPLRRLNESEIIIGLAMDLRDIACRVIRPSDPLRSQIDALDIKEIATLNLEYAHGANIAWEQSEIYVFLRGRDIFSPAYKGPVDVICNGQVIGSYRPEGEQ